MGQAPGRRRAVVLLAAAALGGAALAGCASGEVGGAATDVSPAAASTSPPAAGAGTEQVGTEQAGTTQAGTTEAGTTGSGDLSAGLLPDSAFGNGAEVHSRTGEDHHGFPGWGFGSHAGRWPGTSVEPGSCATALDRLSDGLDEDAADGVRSASRTALLAGTVTVEALAEGLVPTVDQLRTALAACPTAGIGGPGPWQVTFTLTDLGGPALGDGSVAVRADVDASGAGHHSGDGDGAGKRSALLGVAQDGDRLLFLMTTRSDGAAPDEAAFRALLERAYQVQADALD